MHHQAALMPGAPSHQSESDARLAWVERVSLPGVRVTAVAAIDAAEYDRRLGPGVARSRTRAGHAGKGMTQAGRERTWQQARASSGPRSPGTPPQGATESRLGATTATRWCSQSDSRRWASRSTSKTVTRGPVARG